MKAGFNKGKKYKKYKRLKQEQKDMIYKLFLEKIGFYHIINRGVARTNIYHNDEDLSDF
jgi:hypothetical protein